MEGVKKEKKCERKEKSAQDGAMKMSIATINTMYDLLLK